MKKNENGFSVVEALLIVIIVGMLGGVGYYVWHSQAQVDKTYSQTANSSVAPKSKTSTKLNPTDNTKYLVIKEWNIKTKITGDEAPYYDLFAKGQKDMNGDTLSADIAYVYSTKFDNTKNSDGKMCKDVDDNVIDPALYSKPPTKRKFLIIVRYSNADSIPDDASQYAVAPPIKIGSYKYLVSPASLYAPGCSELWRGSVGASLTDENITTLEGQLLRSLTADFKTLGQ
jgi:hypothetical protein